MTAMPRPMACFATTFAKFIDCQIQHFSGLDTPVLQLVQFRDTEGMVTDRFKKAADGVMCLAAADFNEVMKPEDGYNWWFETTQADITGVQDRTSDRFHLPCDRWQPALIIGTEAVAPETALIEAYDINGRLAASSHGRLDLSALVPGLYVLRSGSRTLKYIRP